MIFLVLLVLGLAFDVAGSFFKKKPLILYPLLGIASIFTLVGSIYFVFYFQEKFFGEEPGWVNWTFASFALCFLFLQLLYISSYIKKIGKYLGMAFTFLFFVFALTGVGMLCYFGRIALENESMSSNITNLLAILLA